MLLGGIEGGGTKMVCAIGDEFGKIYDKVSFPTLAPMETMPKIIDYFKAFEICGLGLASFGPVDLNPKSETYGYITSSTKLDWKYYNIMGTLKDALGVPIGIDTDVNVAALGEIAYGCMQGVNTGMYVTVGTGVGIGLYANGAPVHGILHPEGGHILVRRHPEDTFAGICAYHGDCIEGLASGPAIEKRAGMSAKDIPEDAKDWEFVSYYIAQGICAFILSVAPEKIVLGGGVMNRTHVIPMIRSEVVRLLNGYIDTPQIKDIDSYIVPASLGGEQAVKGCMKLAYDRALHS